MEAPIDSESVCDNYERAARRAVIDVGTNSVKLLVADVSRTVKPVLKLSTQMRLGEGAFRTRRLRPEAIARTMDAVAQFAAEAAALRPATIRVIATSAAREAVNGHELIEAIRHVTGLEIDLQERRKLAGLDPQKAEVILPGAVIHEAVLNELGFEEMLITSRGLREGTLLMHSARTDALAESARPLTAGLSSAGQAGWELHLPAGQIG